MTGVTIDHMVSLVALITVLLVSMGAYSQIVSAAISYQWNHQVAMKADELVNTLLLNPGYPADWGRSNSTPSAFGLQDPEIVGYALSSHSIMRLRPSESGGGGGLIYYPKTNSYYSNYSLGSGTSLFMSLADCMNYTTAATLLGVNGSYGFHLTISPLVRVTLTRIDLNPLRLMVEVKGSGSPLAFATLNYYLFMTATNGSEPALTRSFFGNSQADSSGSAFLEFPPVSGTVYAYSIIIYARLGGLFGAGYDSYETVEEPLLVPLVEDFEQGTVVLAHLWDITGPTQGGTAALHYEATFLTLTGSGELHPVEILTEGPLVINYGEGKPYAEVLLPSEPGILVLSYQRGDEDEYGIVMMPWGISALGLSVMFGGNPSSADWVATELRLVTINRVTYQVKLAVWRISGYQPWGARL